MVREKIIWIHQRASVVYWNSARLWITRERIPAPILNLLYINTDEINSVGLTLASLVSFSIALCSVPSKAVWFKISPAL